MTPPQEDDAANRGEDPRAGAIYATCIALKRDS